MMGISLVLARLVESKSRRTLQYATPAEGLSVGEDAREQGLDDDTAQQSGEEFQCAMPALIDAGRMVENQEALNHGPAEPHAGRKVRNLAEDSALASDLTQEDRVFRRRKHEDPMVLPC